MEPFAERRTRRVWDYTSLLIQIVGAILSAMIVEGLRKTARSIKNVRSFLRNAGYFGGGIYLMFGGLFMLLLAWSVLGPVLGFVPPEGHSIANNPPIEILGIVLTVVLGVMSVPLFLFGVWSIRYAFGYRPNRI